jgi:uncharacterized damage-inducible protein DinB
MAAACSLQAQNAPSLSAETKQAYNNIKNYLLRSAEKMPEEHYSFKPVPEVRTFGQLIGHVADAQTRNCSSVKGQPKQGTAGSKTSKADLIAALKESIAECDAAYESLTDANAAEAVTVGRGQRTRLGALNGNIAHDNETYGTMVAYMRLKGLVPPSSDRR